MLRDRWNPRLWLRNALRAAGGWLNKPSPAELAVMEAWRTELMALIDGAFQSPRTPADPGEGQKQHLH